MQVAYKTYPSNPKIRIVDTADMNSWLNRFRSQGILWERTELVSLMYKMISAALECIKRDQKYDENYIQFILVLRDSLPVFTAVLDKFPGSTIGLIGHERFVDEKGTQTIISFKRFEQPSKFKEIIIIDPMIATGGTLKEVLTELLKNGRPEKVIVNSILLTEIAIGKIGDYVDYIYTCSVEKGLEKVAWLNPGIRGTKDLGDIIFNTKLDW